jgi:hypothetical protein
MCQVCINNAQRELVRASFATVEAQAKAKAEQEQLTERELDVMLTITSSRQAHSMGVCMRDAYEATRAHEQAQREEDQAREWLDQVQAAGELCIG